MQTSKIIKCFKILKDLKEMQSGEKYLQLDPGSLSKPIKGDMETFSMYFVALVSPTFVL